MIGNVKKIVKLKYTRLQKFVEKLICYLKAIQYTILFELEYDNWSWVIVPHRHIFMDIFDINTRLLILVVITSWFWPFCKRRSFL